MNLLVTEPSASAIRAYSKERDPAARGAIYARELRPRIEAGEDIPIHADNSLGTVASDLVAQRALDLLVEQFPEIRRVSRNASDERIDLRYGKTVYVSTVTPPTAGTYHTTNGYVSQAATAEDVPVVVDQHKFVQHEFGANELSGSSIDLFQRHAPAMAHGLGLDLVTSLHALITASNFPTSTTVTLANFSRAGVIEVGTKLTNRKVPTFGRTLLLTPDYAGKLFEDEAIVSLSSNSRPDVMTRGVLPDIHGFTPFEAQTLPTGENLGAVALTPSALCLATRLPVDYANALPGATGGGVVSVITEPNTGLSVQRVNFVDHKLGKAYMRLAWMYGVAKGLPDCLERIVYL